MLVSAMPYPKYSKLAVLWLNIELDLYLTAKTVDCITITEINPLFVSKEPHSEDYKMKRESWSVAFLCALGAFIGGLIAKQLGGQYLWTIGALVGGTVAYVAKDFNHFRPGAKRAYNQVFAWQPNRLYWRAFFAQWLGASSFLASFLTFITPFMPWI